MVALGMRIHLCEQEKKGIALVLVLPDARPVPTPVRACRARLTVGLDERSLGFWAMGHGRATGRPAAVITSSGEQECPVACRRPWPLASRQRM